MVEPQRTKRPTLLRGFWEGWTRVAKRMGDIQVRLLLILFYFVVLTPFALMVRWFSDPLAIKIGTTRGWRPKVEEEGLPMERALRQY